MDEVVIKVHVEYKACCDQKILLSFFCMTNLKCVTYQLSPVQSSPFRVEIGLCIESR